MTIFIVIILRGMKAFILNYLVGVGFCWRTVSTDFRAKNPGGCTKSPFSEDLRTEKLGGEACICAAFIYLFVYYLFIYCLFVCLLLFTLRELFVGSCINYVGVFRGYFCGVMWRFCELVLAYFALLWVWCRMWWTACLLFLTYCYYCLYLFVYT